MNPERDRESAERDDESAERDGGERIDEVQRLENLVAACDEALRLATAAVDTRPPVAPAGEDLLGVLVREAEGEVDVELDRVALALEQHGERMRLEPAALAKVLDEIDRAIARADLEVGLVEERRRAEAKTVADWTERAGDVRGPLVEHARERIADHRAALAAIEAELAEYRALADDLGRVRARLLARTRNQV